MLIAATAPTPTAMPVSAGAPAFPTAPAAASVPTPPVRGPIDKSSWPAFAPLPAGLPAAANTHVARYYAGTRFTAGSFADGARGDSLRISPDPHDDERTDATVLAGRDPRAALAAAVKLAGGTFVAPTNDKVLGAPTQTLVGLYQSRSGAMQVAPLWMSPGTNDMTYYHPVAMSATATPDARFRFTDPTLAAVVGPDGWIANPTFASQFA